MIKPKPDFERQTAKDEDYDRFFQEAETVAMDRRRIEQSPAQAERLHSIPASGPV